MEYDKMSKEELIDYIKDCQLKRAFTYEDQIKLAILDNSPFSIWASDHDCKITLWTGQCENMYGYKASEMIGQNYLDMFVADDEKPTAAKDHLSIVDDGKPFHNLARDKHLDGSHPLILTNCFRIRDPKSGNFWYAEMGLNVEFFDDELRKYNEMVTTSQRIRESRHNLETYAEQFKEQISDRKKSLIESLLYGAACARKIGRVNDYSIKMRDFVKRLEAVIDEIDHVATNDNTKITSCDVLNECERIRKEFISKCDRYNTDLALIIVDILAFLQDYDSVNAEVASKRDELIKLINNNDFRLRERITDKVSTINDLRDRFFQSRGATDNSTTISELDQKSSFYTELSQKLSDLSEQLRSSVSQLRTDEEFKKAKKSINEEFSKIEKEID